MATNPGEIAEQALKYSKSISRWISSESLAEIIKFSSDVTRRNWFAIYQDVAFWWERFDKEGLTEKVGGIADSWVQNEDNIKRAAAQVERSEKAATTELVLAFGIYKFKKRANDWELVQQPARGPVEVEVQTMICIALEDLGPFNGFPIELRSGEDVCIDGNDTLLLPPTGGGMAILFWINL